MGFAVASLWVIPGLVMLPIISWMGDEFGLRWGMLLMVPIFLIGGIVVSSSKSTINRDIAEVWNATAARAAVAYDRRHGEAPLLVARGVAVGHDGVQGPFGIALTLHEGEILALPSPNGAEKSHLPNPLPRLTVHTSGPTPIDG